MILSQGVPTFALGGVGANPTSLFLQESNTDYFTIYAGGVPGAANFTPFTKNGTLYQVTTGMTFKARAIGMACSSAGAWMQLVSATATFSDTAAALTGGVYQGAATTKYVFPFLAANTFYSAALQYSFTSLTFPGIQLDTAGAKIGVWLIGKEV